MQVKEIRLCWIVVKNIREALNYYKDVVGLKLVEFSEEHGWAELEGFEGGQRLGIAQESPQEGFKAGQNAVVTFTVANLEESKQAMAKKGATCVGDIVEVPGHIKMQTLVDQDGNHFQICEMLSSDLA